MRADVILIFILILLFYIIDVIKSKMGFLTESDILGNKEFDENEIEGEIAGRTYGKFTLTNAVALFKDSEVIPKEGYQTKQFISREGVLYERMIISVSAERVFYLFDDFLALFGDACGVVLEDFRNTNDEGTEHIDHYGYHKDTVVVRSILCDFEELLVNDGFIGIAIVDENVYAEIQITDHKTIQVFSIDTSPFENVLAKYGIKQDDELQFIFEDSHLHLAKENSDQVIENLTFQLCLEQRVIQRGDSQETIV